MNLPFPFSIIHPSIQKWNRNSKYLFSFFIFMFIFIHIHAMNGNLLFGDTITDFITSKHERFSKKEKFRHICLLSGKEDAGIMNDFSDYTYAQISEKENQEIQSLENKLKSDTGEDVVLIAYAAKGTSTQA